MQGLQAKGRVAAAPSERAQTPEIPHRAAAEAATRSKPWGAGDALAANGSFIAPLGKRAARNRRPRAGRNGFSKRAFSN